MKRPFVALLACAVAVPALAQDASQDASQDWDLVRDAEKKSVLAFTTFDVGLSVAFRCVDGSLNTVIAGLPASRQTRRTLQLGFQDRPAYDSVWTTTTDRSVVVGDFPAMLARDFREGGSLKLTVPGGATDGRNLRFEVELPTSSGAIDEVLTSCGRPLVDPRDEIMAAIPDSGLPVGMEWTRPPRPSFPRTNYASGFVVTTCLTTPEGRLDECVVEMEHPYDSGFGEATLRSTRRARLRNTAQPGQPVPAQLVSFRTSFIQPQ